MKRILEVIKAEQKYLTIATLVFLTSAISGYMNAQPLLEVLKQNGVFDQLKKVVIIIHHNPTFFHTFLTLFINNITASFTMIGLGLFFGIVPLLSMLSNGMLLGVTLMTAAEKTGANPLIIFATTILPHGILELPAAIFAAAFGMRLGVALFRRVVALFIPSRLEASVLEWKGIIKRLPIVLIGVTVFILVAAIIEASLIIYIKPLG